MTMLSNLSPEQTLALESLKNNFGITIKASDKGGNVVLMDNELYENMCLKMLSENIFVPRLKVQPRFLSAGG